MSPTEAWWAGLSAAAALNLGLWAWLWSRRGDDPERRTRLLLAGGFAAGCALRGVLPRADVQRYVLVDHWLSGIMVGRAAATVAELCLMALLARALHQLAVGRGAMRVAGMTRAIVPMIAVAEAWSWYAVATTRNLGHVVEESTWLLAGLLLTAGLAALRPPMRYWPLIALGTGYVAFMALVDVPMYAARHMADMQAGRAFLPLGAGLADLAAHRTVTFDWAIWREEAPWMTLYFTVSVWAALALAWAPAAAERDGGGRPEGVS